MLHTDQSKSTSTTILLSVGVTLSLGIFLATYFTYFSRHQLHISGSYLPLVIGVISFSGLMFWLSYLALISQKSTARFVKAASFSLVLTVVFIFMLSFLILNTIGS
ncbi:MAG: hypothetical protein H7Z20_08830 [Bdellovibrio sp.]|nr:hypothetical protein [Methylotenera sp.]